MGKIENSKVPFRAKVATSCAHGVIMRIAGWQGDSQNHPTTTTATAIFYSFCFHFILIIRDWIITFFITRISAKCSVTNHEVEKVYIEEFFCSISHLKL